MRSTTTTTTALFALVAAVAAWTAPGAYAAKECLQTCLGHRDECDGVHQGQLPRRLQADRPPAPSMLQTGETHLAFRDEEVPPEPA